MMRKAIFILILPFYFLMYSANAQQTRKVGFFLDEGRKRITIPFELHHNLIVITGTVNGKIPLKFVFDTGVKSPILLDAIYAELLEIPLTRTITIMGVGDFQSVEAYVGNNVEMDFGGLNAAGVSVLVLKEDYLKLKNYIGTEVHGIIGFDVFSRFEVEIDYPNKVIRLFKEGTFKKKRKYKAFDLEILDTKPHIVLPVIIDDDTALDARLMMDTGASLALILHSNKDDLIQIPEERIRAKLGRGISGDIDGYVSRIYGLTIGQDTLYDVIASFPDEDAYGDSLAIENRIGTIGGKILSRYRIVFKYHENKVLLRRGRGFKAPFNYNMSGLEIMATGMGLDSIVVKSVREGSPAELAGIAEGDKILSVNEFSGTKLNIDHIYNLFNTREGRTVSLIIYRDGERIRKNFVLKKEI